MEKSTYKIQHMDCASEENMVRMKLDGLLVLFTGSAIPDLVVGAIVFVIVIRGAFRILKLAK